MGTLLAILIFSISISRLNSHIGFQKICQKAQTIAQENNIEKYYFYKFQSGENMDTYLKMEIFPLDLSNQDFFQINKNSYFLLGKKT